MLYSDNIKLSLPRDMLVCGRPVIISNNVNCLHNRVAASIVLRKLRFFFNKDIFDVSAKCCDDRCLLREVTPWYNIEQSSPEDIVYGFVYLLKIVVQISKTLSLCHH